MRRWKRYDAGQRLNEDERFGDGRKVFEEKLPCLTKRLSKRERSILE
jgi:hypothetical protein